MKNNALKKAENALGEEQIRQISIIYCACGIIWGKDYNWDDNHIMETLAVSEATWDECGRKTESIFEILEDETGIEMVLDGYKSYKDIVYLYGGYDPSNWSVAKMINMRIQQKKWVAPMVLASVCISLARAEGWDSDQLEEFLQKVDALRMELGENEDAYGERLRQVTGIVWRLKPKGKKQGSSV